MATRESLPSILRTFLIGTVLLGALWAITQFCCIHFLGLNSFPYNRMILPRVNDFVDYAMFNPRFEHFHTHAFFDPGIAGPFLYPAPVAVLYAFTHLFTDPLHHPLVGFPILLVLVFICIAALLAWGLRRAGLSAEAAAAFSSVSLLTSYPVYFEINRSNMEIFVWALAGGGVWAFLRNHPWLAAALIGLAGSCKLYPYILLGLLLLRRQYRQTAFGILVGVLSTLASLWAVTGDISFTAHKVAEGLRTFHNDYVLTRHAIEVGLDHSLFGLFKRPLVQMPQLSVAAHYLTLYLAIAALTGTVLFFTKVRKLPVSNQITFITVATILLPPVSYDYTLLQLYTPWAVLVFLAIRHWHQGLPVTRGLRNAFYCFIFLLSPQNEIILHGAKLEGQIKCLALIALAVVSLLNPFENAQPPLKSKRSSNETPSTPLSSAPL